MHEPRRHGVVNSRRFETPSAPHTQDRQKKIDRQKHHKQQASNLSGLNPLAGTWKLERWTCGAREPFGDRPEGTLVYTLEGTMIAAFMRRGRVAVAPSLEALAAWRLAPGSGDLERRFLEAALSFNAYSGRYLLEQDRVHHDVDVALYPEWIGQRLTRDFRVDGDRLTLSFGIDALIWTKALRR